MAWKKERACVLLTNRPAGQEQQFSRAYMVVELTSYPAKQPVKGRQLSALSGSMIANGFSGSMIANAW